MDGMEGTGSSGLGESDTDREEVQPQLVEESSRLRNNFLIKCYKQCLVNIIKGLLLIGGAGSPTTTEYVKTDIEENPEEAEQEEEEEEGKKKKPRNVYGFSMEHKIQDMCGISVEDTYIMTGWSDVLEQK